jgi:EAL domain-containing protein (putative c-di-GMP-specific phosphodiesterase class I)
MIIYNSIGEYASLLIAGLLLFVMLYTNPKKSYVYRYIFLGNIWAIFAIIIQIIILHIASNPGSLFNPTLFMTLLILFALAYNGVLYYIFSYVNMMSIQRRRQRREFLLMYTALSACYIIALVVDIAVSGLYEMTLNGIDIAHFTRFYCIAGMVTCIICFYASVTNRTNISRVIWHTVCIIVPTEIIILCAQIYCISTNHTVFSGLTYVPVFTLAFLLFHNIPYDEQSGCRSINALDDFLKKNTGRRKFYLMYAEFRMPTADNFINENDDEIMYIGLSACRAIEGISPKVTMYRLENEKFVNIINCSDEKQAKKYADQIRGVYDGVKAELKVPFNYIIIVEEVTPELDGPLKVRELNEYICKRFKDQNSSYYYVAKPEDMASFSDVYDITVALKDIRNRLNLDDERVQVYAQPIYSVEEGAFKVAEALMRLKVGDKMYTPDMFIPIAESGGCVHALTCIILNKVCRAVESLEEYYDFDAISINVSSKELSHKTMYQDYLDIIERYDFDVSKIRMEITETAMFENYEQASTNMKILNQAGIQLYLDDFGTGYSSLERIMNCPVKTIKFDKTILYKSLDDDRMDDILSYMIEVLKKNGFITLVEGVEDESQNQYSVNRGFDYIQGYHYAKPEPIEELKKYFSRKNSF